MFHKKCKVQIKILGERIAELEEIICPNESHKWRHDVKTYTDNDGISLTYTESKCLKCGKVN